MANEAHVGQRLSYGGDLCTVRYIGEVKGTKGQWLGVEWDDATRGKHDGQVGGLRYFTCLSKGPTAASFIRPNRPADKGRTFVEALRYKYAYEHTTISFEIGKPVEKAIKISGKEVEEVGFEKIRKQLAELHELRIVLLDGFCISQPINRSGRDHGNLPVLSDIRHVCPNIIELDLSRNLFEEWYEVVLICDQLENLVSLRVDGNRFSQAIFTESERSHFLSTFRKVKHLSLENTLLTWTKSVEICALFQSLQSVCLSNNSFGKLHTDVCFEALPQSITTIDLESSSFESLSDLQILAGLPNLQKLILKKNSISRITTTSHLPSFPPNITDIDISYNSIDSWFFISSLSATFPGLKSLRIAHNPLFDHLQAPDGRSLTPDEGYMLTIARLKSLDMLNHSRIAAKDRLNAESYYLSMIVSELSFAPEEEKERILKAHPRWRDLCEEFGEPEYRSSNVKVNQKSLAARLLNLRCRLSNSVLSKVATDTEVESTFEIPQSLSVYAVLGVVGKHFGLPPMRLRLFWESAEWDLMKADQSHRDGDLWESDEEYTSGVEDPESDLKDKLVRRDIEIIAGTRAIETWVDVPDADIRVEIA